jgi:hypothetical protein
METAPANQRIYGFLIESKDAFLDLLDLNHA